MSSGTRQEQLEGLLRDWQGHQRLNESQRKAIVQSAVHRSLQKDESLFEEGAAGKGLFIVHEGEIKICKISSGGREQILYMARSGKFILEALGLRGEPCPAHAIATREGDAWMIPSGTMLELARANPEFAIEMFELLFNRTMRYIALVEDVTLRNVRSRLASFLYTRALNQGTDAGTGEVTLVRDLTTETVASRLGTVREEISRALSALETEGVISLSRKAIVIKDMSLLENFMYDEED
ncbi:MAG: CRP-like cAMP-activated global transcriptional regulator [Myxococcota bacterium]|nr:CRP-like cAMP-activated global transcriptional regulator [Myxococcota bacterium]